MLEAKASTFGGTVKNLSIDDIKDHICMMVSGCIKTFKKEPPQEYDREGYQFWLQGNLFGADRYIHVNSKNIEFATCFHLSENIITDKIRAKMDELGIGDVLIELIVYRLGQHSYYSAECTTLLS